MDATDAASASTGAASTAGAGGRLVHHPSMWRWRTDRRGAARRSDSASSSGLVVRTPSTTTTHVGETRLRSLRTSSPSTSNRSSSSLSALSEGCTRHTRRSVVALGWAATHTNSSSRSACCGSKPRGIGTLSSTSPRPREPAVVATARSSDGETHSGSSGFVHNSQAMSPARARRRRVDTPARAKRVGLGTRAAIRHRSGGGSASRQAKLSFGMSAGSISRQIRCSVSP